MAQATGTDGGAMDGEAMRIGELAERSGVSVRKIRFYHQLGILPRPHVRGRVGWYSGAHLRRLELVRRMQGRGYSLAAIADMVEHQVPAILRDGPDAADGVAGADHADGVPGADPVDGGGDGGDGGDNRDGGGDNGDGGDGDASDAMAGPVTLEALHQLLPDLAREPALVDRMAALGLLAPAGAGSFVVPQPALLRAGVALVVRGVPIRSALDELELLRRDLDTIAERFAEVFTRELLPARLPPAGAALDLLQEVWPPVLVAMGRLLTEATERAVVRRTAGADPRRPEPDNRHEGFVTDS